VGEALPFGEALDKTAHRLLSKPLPGQRFSSLAGGAPRKLLILPGTHKLLFVLLVIRYRGRVTNAAQRNIL